MKYGKVSLGTIEAVFNKLGGEEAVQSFLAGDLEVVPKKHHISCNVGPSVPKGFSTEKHAINKSLEWDARSPHLTFRKMRILALEKKLLQVAGTDNKYLNANVLEYLLKNPRLIPASWMDLKVYFLGTTYLSKANEVMVKYLFWRKIDDNEGEWDWQIEYLSVENWREPDVAAMRVD